MANTVIALKKSGTPSSVPSNLANGELAINYADGKLYYKAANGTIASISGNEPNYFGSVNAAGTFVVADVPGDVLTLIAGDNITITGDGINDTVTISASIAGGDPSYAFNKANLAYAQANTAFEDSNNRLSIDGGTLYGTVQFGGVNFALGRLNAGTLDLFANTTSRQVQLNHDNKRFIFVDAWTANLFTANASIVAEDDNKRLILRANSRNWYLSGTGSFNFPDGSLQNTAFSYIQYNTINAAFSQANAAFDAANNAVTDFSPAFNQANSAYFQANSAFDKANIPPVVVSNTTPTSPEPNTLWWNSQLGRMFIYYQDVDSSQWIEATPGGIKAEDLENASRHANLAFNQANTGRTHANASYAFANSAHAIANAAYSHANVIYDFANSAHAIANIAFTHANNAYNEANTVNIYSDSTYVKLTAPSQTVTGDFAIVGSLSVSGNTYIVNSESLRVADPLLYLAGNNYTSDIVDIGFIANYVNATGQNVHTGLYREHENKEYYLFQGYDAEPINNHIGPMSNNMTLAVLNADIKTSNITLGGVNAISRIDASHNQANAAYDKANSVIEAGYYAGNNGEVGRAAGLGDIFRVHTNVLNANVTIYSGNNALAAGPITVASGRVFTIQANARVAIV